MRRFDRDYGDRLLTGCVVIFAVVGMATTGRNQAIAMIVVVTLELTRLVLL